MFVNDVVLVRESRKVVNIILEQQIPVHEEKLLRIGRSKIKTNMYDYDAIDQEMYRTKYIMILNGDIVFMRIIGLSTYLDLVM